MVLMGKAVLQDKDLCRCPVQGRGKRRLEQGRNDRECQGAIMARGQRQKALQGGAVSAGIVVAPPESQGVPIRAYARLPAPLPMTSSCSRRSHLEDLPQNCRGFGGPVQVKIR